MRPPAWAPDALPSDLDPVPVEVFCPTAGTVQPLGRYTLRVDDGGMRGVVAGDRSRRVEIAFVYLGASSDVAPLASGELRRQIGLKLRASDTCNVVYVTWHVEPSARTPAGVFVSVKSNPGASTHRECGATGYVNVTPEATRAAPRVAPGDVHGLRAELDGERLRVWADSVIVWEGLLPKEALAFDGPAGVRSDNGAFEFVLRVPRGNLGSFSCPE